MGEGFQIGTLIGSLIDPAEFALIEGLAFLADPIGGLGLAGGNSNRRVAGARPPWSAGAARNRAPPCWCAIPARAHADGRCFWNHATTAAECRRRGASGGRASR